MKNQLKMNHPKETEETVKSNSDSLEMPSINHFYEELWTN